MELEDQDHSRRVEWERGILRKVRVENWKWRRLPHPPKPKDPEEEKKAQEDKETAERKALQKKQHSLKGRILGALCEEKGKKDEGKTNTKKKRKSTEPSKEPRPRPADSYGLTVSKIVLRRSDPGCSSSFMSYDMQKYPLNDCLFKEENNPLTQECEPNTIRYFHLPANNMHWIEVHSLAIITTLALILL
jgi:hypothetical protein